MLLKEDREIIDIYNRRILNENKAPMSKEEAEIRNKGNAKNIINKFFASRENEKHVGNPNFRNVNTGSIFQGYSTVQLKNALLNDNIKWSMPESAGSGDKKLTSNNFPITTTQYGELGVLPTTSLADNDDIELNLNGNKLESIFDYKGQKPKTNTVTMIYNDSDPNPENLKAKSIYPGPNKVGRNNIFLDSSEDITGPNVNFIPFARLIK
jgi:hypothetical protein